jgi:hypothetical protein
LRSQSDGSWPNSRVRPVWKVKGSMRLL